MTKLKLVLLGFLATFIAATTALSAEKMLDTPKIVQDEGVQIDEVPLLSAVKVPSGETKRKPQPFTYQLCAVFVKENDERHFATSWDDSKASVGVIMGVNSHGTAYFFTKNDEILLQVMKEVQKVDTLKIATFEDMGVCQDFKGYVWNITFVSPKTTSL